MRSWVLPVLAACAACSSTPFQLAEAPTAAHILYESVRDDELLLVNANTWLVPVHAGHHARRLEGFADFVRSLPAPPDVITLQEVWQAKRVAALEELFPGYRTHTSGAHRTVLGMRLNESGLVTLVRRGLEVTAVEYTLLEAEQLVSYNRLVGKGALAIDVVHRGQSYRIINVHLPNTFGGRYAWKTRECLDSLDLDGVVAGDLNLEPHQLPDELVVPDRTPTFGNDGLGRERTRRIDYVLGDDATAVRSVVVTGANGRCLPLSDHCALAAALSPRRDEPSARVVSTALGSAAAAATEGTR